MVMTNDKWFNEMDGEQAFPSLAVTTEQSERSDRRPIYGSAPAGRPVKCPRATREAVDCRRRVLGFLFSQSVRLGPRASCAIAA